MKDKKSKNDDDSQYVQSLQKDLENEKKIYDDFFKHQANIEVIENLKKLDDKYAFFDTDTDTSTKQINLLATYTLCLDIRKSTDLMVVCKSMNDYYSFIEDIISTSNEIITKHNGIYDKFTGDGILCHFIEEIDEKSYLSCMQCAIELHKNFKKWYKKYTKNEKFKLDILNIGIGIGIDYGQVFFKVRTNQLFAIGESVNYACRLSSAPAGRTYFNTNAYFNIIKKDFYLCHLFTNKEINIKGKESSIMAYEFNN